MHHNSQSPTGGTLLSTSGLPVLADAAYRGLAGAIVHAIASSIEAQPVALLGGVGSGIGRGAWSAASGTMHFSKEFLAIVGRSAGAHGSAAVATSRAMLDRAGLLPPPVKGLVSEEGIIEAIRDAEPSTSPHPDATAPHDSKRTFCTTNLNKKMRAAPVQKKAALKLTNNRKNDNEAASAPQPQNTHETQPAPPDIFADLAKIRVDATMSDGPSVAKVLANVPVRKPDKAWFVRTHPDAENYSLDALALELKQEGENIHPRSRAQRSTFADGKPGEVRNTIPTEERPARAERNWPLRWVDDARRKASR